MFEARRLAASRLLSMFGAEHQRSTEIGKALGVEFTLSGVKRTSQETADEGNNIGLKEILMGGTAVAATLAGMFKLSSPSVPEGYEDSSILDKAKDWTSDFFGNKKEETAVPGPAVHMGPSPLTNSKELDAYAIKTAQSDAETRAAIRIASDRQKVDYALMYAVAGAESSFRKDVSASTSSAVGLYQFTAPTWKYLVNKYKLDFTADDRRDPKKSAQIAGMYINDISTTLKRLLGRAPSYGEVYMGYFLGPTGASRFLEALKKNPQAIGAELFPKAAKANPNVFYAKGDTSKPLTLSQILGKQEGKISSYARDVDPLYAKAEPKSIEQAPTMEQVTTAKSRPMTQTSAMGSSVPSTPKPMTVALPRAVNEVVTYEEAEARTTKQERIVTQQSPQSSGLVINSGSEQSQPMTIVRGRDKRLYTLNG